MSSSAIQEQVFLKQATTWRIGLFGVNQRRFIQDKRKAVRERSECQSGGLSGLAGNEVSESTETSADHDSGPHAD